MKYQKSLPVSKSHLVKQNVVGEWVPLESGSETMTVSVLVYTNTKKEHELSKSVLLIDL